MRQSSGSGLVSYLIPLPSRPRAAPGNTPRTAALRRRARGTRLRRSRAAPSRSGARRGRVRAARRFAAPGRRPEKCRDGRRRRAGRFPPSTATTPRSASMAAMPRRQELVEAARSRPSRAGRASAVRVAIFGARQAGGAQRLLGQRNRSAVNGSTASEAAPRWNPRPPWISAGGDDRGEPPNPPARRRSGSGPAIAAIAASRGSAAISSASARFDVRRPSRSAASVSSAGCRRAPCRLIGPRTGPRRSSLEGFDPRARRRRSGSGDLRYEIGDRPARPEGVLAGVVAVLHAEHLLQDLEIVRDVEGVARRLIAEEVGEIVEAAQVMAERQSEHGSCVERNRQSRVAGRSSAGSRR